MCVCASSHSLRKVSVPPPIFSPSLPCINQGKAHFHWREVNTPALTYTMRKPWKLRASLHPLDAHSNSGADWQLLVPTSPLNHVHT